MKAGEFGYARAASLPEALALLHAHGEGAKLLAGGQSLLPALNLRLSSPALLIDIGRLEALRGIALRDGVLTIGALTTHETLRTSPLIATHAPLLVRAAAHIAHPAIRSRGTIGGSLANADPAAELPACMLALGARLVTTSWRGERIVAADTFFTGLFATALAADEILTRIEIAPPSPTARTGFAELARRGGDYAIVGLAAHGEWSDAQFTALRLAFFSVGPTATLARGAAAALAGRSVTQDALRDAEAALASDLAPHDDPQASAATRMTLARVLLRRVIAEMT